MDVNTTWWTTNEVDNGDQYLGGFNSVVFYGHSGPNHALTVWDNGLACTQRGRGTLSQCYQASKAQLQTGVSWRIHNSSEAVYKVALVLFKSADPGIQTGIVKTGTVNL